MRADQSTVPAATPPSRSSAFWTYKRNVGMSLDLLQVVQRDSLFLRTARANLEAKVQQLPPFTPENVKALNSQFNALAARLRKLLLRQRRIDTVFRWQIVCLVTCVEAYLQDVLQGAALVDPQLMARSEQAASYAEVVAAQNASDLAEELRSRWARNWVSDGGPTRWVDRLARMGVQGFEADLAASLEPLWGARHVIVHSAGIITRDFLRRHAYPGVQKAGDPINVTFDQYKSLFTSTLAFVRTTDSYFVARFPSLAMPEPEDSIDTLVNSLRSTPRTRKSTRSHGAA